jgi:hypothetical protein
VASGGKASSDTNLIRLSDTHVEEPVWILQAEPFGTSGVADVGVDDHKATVGFAHTFQGTAESVASGFAQRARRFN